jgi:peptidoglycan/LPS O-acetylase OafA/YrhL
MSNPSWFRAIISGLAGAAIGVIFVAIANLVSPVANLPQLLVVVCVPAFLAAIVGHIIGARQKRAS